MDPPFNKCLQELSKHRMRRDSDENAIIGMRSLQIHKYEFRNAFFKAWSCCLIHPAAFIFRNLSIVGIGVSEVQVSATKICTHFTLVTKRSKGHSFLPSTYRRSLFPSLNLLDDVPLHVDVLNFSSFFRASETRYSFNRHDAINLALLSSLL